MTKQQIFAFTNIVRDVGSTTLIREIAVGMAARGLRVLVIDLDPQGSLTEWLNIPEAQGDIALERSAFLACTEKGVALPTPISSFGVDVIPSSLALAQLDMGVPAPALLYLRRNLSAYREHYDYILIDPPMNLGTISQIAALASDGLFIAMNTDGKPRLRLETILEFKYGLAEFLPGYDLPIIAQIVTKFDARHDSARDNLAVIKHHYVSSPMIGVLEFHAIYGRAVALRIPVKLLEPHGAAAGQLNTVTENFIAMTQPHALEVYIGGKLEVTR